MKRKYYIYKLVNRSTGRTYTGLTRNATNRKNIHMCRLKGNNHDSKHMQSDFNAGCQFDFLIVREIFCTPHEATVIESENIDTITYNIQKSIPQKADAEIKQAKEIARAIAPKGKYKEVLKYILNHKAA